MSIDTLPRWHALVNSRDMRGLKDLLAEEIVFHSPVVHTPQVGKPLAQMYLCAAGQVFLNDSFRYVREVSGPRDAVLEFVVEMDGITVNGVDMLKWDAAGRITDFKVMLRPLKALTVVQQKMAAMLQANQ